MPSGWSCRKQLPEHAKTLNLEVPFSQSFQMGLSDPSVAVAPVLRYKPDMIFLGGFTNDIILIIKALRGVGVDRADLRRRSGRHRFGRQGTRRCGGSLLRADDVELGSQRCPATRNWSRPTRRRIRSDPYPPANEQLGQGYVHGMILRQALEKAASRDPKTLRDVLASTEFTNLPMPADKVKFGPDGLNVYNTPVLAEWLKGELRTVWPKASQAVQPQI